VVGMEKAPATLLVCQLRVDSEAGADQIWHPFYQSQPSWETYASLLSLARAVRRDLRDLQPRDMIDIQSFLWVQGSEE
jgi:hypothetical protein